MSEIDQKLEQLTAQVNELATNQKALLKKMESGGTAALIKSIESMRKSLTVNLRESTRGDLDQFKQDILSELQNNNATPSDDLSKAASLIATKVDSISSFDVARTSDLVSLSKSIKEYGEGFKSNSGDITKAVESSLDEKLASSISKTDLERFGVALLKQFTTLAPKNASGVTEEVLQNALASFDKKAVKREDLEKLAAALISRLSIKEELTTSTDLVKLNDNLASNFQKMLTELKSSNLQPKDLESFGKQLVKVTNDNLNKSLEKINIANDIVGKLKLDKEFMKTSDIATIEKQIALQINNIPSKLLSKKDLESFGKSLLTALSQDVKTDNQAIEKNIEQMDVLAKKMVTTEHLTQLNKNILAMLKPVLGLNDSIKTNLNQSVELIKHELAHNTKSLKIPELEKRITDVVEAMPDTQTLNMLGKSIVEAVDKKTLTALKSLDNKELLEQAFAKLGQMNIDNSQKLLDQVLTNSFSKSDAEKMLQIINQNVSSSNNKELFEAFGKQLLENIKTINGKFNTQIQEELSSANQSQVVAIEDKVAELGLNVLSGMDDRLETQSLSIEASLRKIGNLKDLGGDVKIIKDKVSNVSVQLDDKMLNQLSKSVSETLRKEGGINRKDLVELDEKIKNYTKGAASAVVTAQKKQFDEMSQKYTNNDVSQHINVAFSNITKIVTSVKRTVIITASVIIVMGLAYAAGATVLSSI